MPNAVLVAEPEAETRAYLGRHLRDDGFDVLDASRRSEALEIAERVHPIVLASSADPVERVRALDRGADDAVGRPFAYEELLARIRAVLRRSGAPSTEVLVAGDLVVDRRTRRASVRDTSIALSAKEFELVARLATDPHRVFTKEDLLRDVWGFRALGRTRTLESHASRVRKKLRIAEDDRYVVNVWGVGYRLME